MLQLSSIFLVLTMMVSCQEATDFLTRNDIDECLQSPCQNGATCHDGIGKYTCACTEGFDGDECQNNIDECDKYNPCKNGARCIGRNDFYCVNILLIIFS